MSKPSLPPIKRLDSAHSWVLFKICVNNDCSPEEAASMVVKKFGVYAPLFYDYCNDLLKAKESEIESGELLKF